MKLEIKKEKFCCMKYKTIAEIEKENPNMPEVIGIKED